MSDRRQHITEVSPDAKSALRSGSDNRLQALKQTTAEMEAELRRIGLWQACDVDDKKLAALEHKIEQQVRSQDVTVWMKAGMPRNDSLRLLALTALEPEGCLDAIRNEMRRRQDSLKSVGQSLKTITEHASGLLKRSSSNADWWFCFHGGGLAIDFGLPHPPASRADISQLLSEMEALSEMLENEQRRFGRYLRAVGRVRPQVVQLLMSCWARCSARRNQLGKQNSVRFRLDHSDALAWLLSIAFACAGQRNVRFSADGLRRKFERHVIPLLELRLQELPRGTH